MIVCLVALSAGFTHGLPTLSSLRAKIERLTYSKGNSSKFDLTACVNVSIPNEEATIVLVDHGSQVNIPGNQQTDPKCYLFTDIVFPDDGSNVRYDMHLHASGSLFGTLGKVNYTFQHVSDVSSFSCANATYSRVVYASTHAQGANEFCFKDPANTCYMTGSTPVAEKGSLCLPTTDHMTGGGLTYCQPGTSNNFNTDKLSAVLNYDGYVDFQTSVSPTPVPTETILSHAGDVSFHYVKDNHVPVKDFKPSNTEYKVCAVSTTGASVTKVNGATLQDVTLTGLDKDGQDGSIGWTKLTQAQYTAVGLEEVAETCTRVGLNQPCYAFLPCGAEVKLTSADGNTNIDAPHLFSA